MLKNGFRSMISFEKISVLDSNFTRVVQKVLSLIGFLGFIPDIFLKCFPALE